MKLKAWVKIVLTLIILMISVTVYMNISYWGFLARSSKFYEFVSIIGWFWLIVGQIVVYERIWR